MTAKSPTMSVKSREIIGGDQFSQRREVFDKHDTVFLPASPTSLAPASDVEPIITSNHGKTTSNFKRNTPGYSSMRESRTEEVERDFRPRKYSDNYTSELNQSDDVDYRRSMTDRTRRLSKLRRDFMTSNIHEPTGSPFNRAGTRASLPAKSYSPNSPKYKIESPNLYKFPFAEPYRTPTSIRKVRLDLGSSEVDGGGKENEDPKQRHLSLPDNNNTSPIDHNKLFDELVKRYSPQRKPVDWKLPPTKPRVIGSVPKSSADSLEINEKKTVEEKVGDDDVFEKIENNIDASQNVKIPYADPKVDGTQAVVKNGPERLDTKETNSKVSLSELDEKNDQVPELGNFQRQLSRESAKKPHIEYVDMTIPDLIDKMTAEGKEIESHSKGTTKVKRKRSFIDKLLGRNKAK